MTTSKQLQASLILDMINIDSELAMDIMTTYSKGLELATFPPDTLKTLDDYLPVRMVNSGLECVPISSHLESHEWSKLLADHPQRLSNYVVLWNGHLPHPQ